MRSFIEATAVAFVATLGLAQAAFAAPSSQRHLGTAEQQARAAQWNQQHAFVVPEAWNVVRPFAEFEPSGFVAISGDDDYELPELREAIAKNLPTDATLIVYVSSTARAAALKQQLGQYLGERLKFVTTPRGGDPIWARDSLPFPVHLKPAGTSAREFGLVASIYPQDFDPNAAFARALSLQSVSTRQYFRGGNLLMDKKANCFSENVNETGDLSDPVGFLKQYFGCATVTLLEQDGGIGDIDERIKFLDGNIVLADEDTYAEILTDKGYDVRRVPKTGRTYETYMNSLIVNGTAFVPQMGLSSDAKALQAYRDAGFKAVGVLTKQLADYGNGNIHCVTMNYPAGSFTPSLTHPDFVEFAQAR